MAKELDGLKEGPKAEINRDLLRTTPKNIKFEKKQAMMELMDSGSRNSPPFTADQHSK